MLDFTEESQIQVDTPVAADKESCKGLFDDFFETPSV
jgi:hypothetical protein